MKAVLLLLALAGCASPGGSARECVYDAPLRFSEATIRVMEPADRLALLTHNRSVEAICSRS